MNYSILIDALETLGIFSDNFFNFMDGKVKSYPLQVNEFGWACFPVLNNLGELIDIRVLVPNIVDLETLLVNIHEFAHAYELFEKIGTVYIEDVLKSETFARSMEIKYLELLRKKTLPLPSDIFLSDEAVDSMNAKLLKKYKIKDH